MPKTYGNFIGGKWVETASKEVFQVFNPARSSELVAEFQQSAPSDVKSAVDAAAGAFEAWAKIPAPLRGVILSKAADILRRRLEEVATLLTREEGKPIMEARGEVDRGVALLDFYAGQSALLTGQTLPSAMPGRFLYTLRAPWGRWR